MHFLSVCCIIKDEVDLEEWIIYHRIIGVNHFYIYDNESHIPLSIRLSQKYFTDCCTIIPFPGQQKQLDTYRHCVDNYKNDTQWMMFIDGDEYVYPKRDGNLPKFLETMNEYDAIGINWVMFGSNFHEDIPNGLVIDSYTKREPNFNIHIKTICNPRKFLGLQNPHFFRMEDLNKYVNCIGTKITGPHVNIDTSYIIRINHYFIRSHEHFRMRCRRGRADIQNTYLDPDNLHGKPIEQLYNDVEDTEITEHSKRIKRVFEKWNIQKISPEILVPNKQTP